MSYTEENGKKNRLSFGAYPVVTLATAREKRLKTKQLIDAGQDPAQVRRIAKKQRNTAAANTFEVIAREWHSNKEDSWRESTSKNVLRRLERDIFPILGKCPITEIKAPLMLDALRQIEKRGALEMARRCAQFSGQVFRYAIATGRAEVDPVPSLRGALKARANLQLEGQPKVEAATEFRDLLLERIVGRRVDHLLVGQVVDAEAQLHVRRQLLGQC
jgi:integrase